MKPLVVGLAVFGVLIFSNKPLFAGPYSDPAPPAQPEKPVPIELTISERDHIKKLYQTISEKIVTRSVEIPNDPYAQLKSTDDLFKGADRYNIQVQDTTFSMPDKNRGKMRKLDDRKNNLEVQLTEHIDATMLAIEQGELTAQETIILDEVEFNAQIRAIHQLLNPPERLDPLFKWFLYLNRVTPEMVEYYQTALEKRDRIYDLASKSDGKLKIRLNGEVMNDAVYVWPDQDVRYELVIVPPASSGQPIS